MSSFQFDSGVGSVLTMASVVGGLANNAIMIGNSCYGSSEWVYDEHIVPGYVTTDLGLPPFPVKVAGGGNIIKWSASFEVTASAGVDLSQLDPLGLLGIKNPEVHAQLYHGTALTGSPIAIDQIVYDLVDDISLGEIPLIGATQAYTAVKTMTTQYTVADGDYLMARFYIYSDLASSLVGFHAQALVDID